MDQAPRPARTTTPKRSDPTAVEALPFASARASACDLAENTNTGRTHKADAKIERTYYTKADKRA